LFDNVMVIMLMAVMFRCERLNGTLHSHGICNTI
jgi:hypothetical protein